MEYGNPYMHYELDDQGNYVLVTEGEHRVIGKTVAICFSYDPSEDRGIKSCLHKHGSPELINNWASDTRKKYIETEEPFAHIMADQITVMEGIFPLDELDKILSITGYIGTYYERTREEVDRIQEYSTEDEGWRDVD